MLKTYILLLILSLSFGGSLVAADKDITISSAGVDALRLSIPPDAEVSKSKKGEQTTIQAKTWKVYLWPALHSRTVDEALNAVNEVIKPEFTDFSVSEADDLTVAGNPAKHLTGKGAEADDGDPGTADVVVFSVSGHVFVACVHGEKDAAAKQRPDLLALLKTVKAP